ncbi:MAG: hypothetical protein B9S32_15355 [Verrucomicrobia bacterium Tous-C9LFEB]|nr:MAG: hypothetical protein B9S32_15355 [Verrucomicrobia bacterium Tous-C9LFEB]
MSVRSLANFYQTLLSIARLQLKDCPGLYEQTVVRREIKRFEHQLDRLQARAATLRRKQTRPGDR